MSKKSRNKRDASDIANRRLPDQHYRLSKYDRQRQMDLFISPPDMRSFDPTAEQPVFATPVNDAWTVPSRGKRQNHREALEFLDVAVSVPHTSPKRPQPDPSQICASRQRRREVLHALKKTRGAGPGKRTWMSKVKC